MDVIVHSYSIEPSAEGDGYWAVAHGEYGESSVLAGQYYYAKLEFFPKLKDAKKEYPQATVSENCSSGLMRHLLGRISDVAPDWFDPTYAGERWEEEN